MEESNRKTMANIPTFMKEYGQKISDRLKNYKKETNEIPIPIT